MDISALLLYYEEVFQQTLQAGLLTSGSSYWLHLPLDKRLRVASATFVTEYSGGTVPFAPINEFLPQRHKEFIHMCLALSSLDYSKKSKVGFPFSPNGYIGTPIMYISL